MSCEATSEGTSRSPSFSDLRNLYGLGPAEGLQGEVSVFDSEPSISRIINGKLQVYRGFNVKACFLVYAQVAAWRSVTIQSEIADEETLENCILNLASEFHIDVSRPFPFLINATPVRATFHVLDKRDGFPHNPELHEGQGSVRTRAANCGGDRLLFESAPWDLYTR